MYPETRTHEKFTCDDHSNRQTNKEVKSLNADDIKPGVIAEDNY